jgi:hypothetical protein
MPLTGSQGRKRAKQGAGLAAHAGTVYALKGGNTTEFWSYAVAAAQWTEADAMPAGGSNRRVKGGGSLVYAEPPNTVFALKGNNTSEFWSYPLASDLAARGPDPNQSSGAAKPGSEFTLLCAPNPCRSAADVSYSLPAEGPALLTLHDAVGRLRSVITQGCLPAGRYSVPISAADLRLPRGVYLLRLEAAERRLTRKLIIN